MQRGGRDEAAGTTLHAEGMLRLARRLSLAVALTAAAGFSALGAASAAAATPTIAAGSVTSVEASSAVLHTTVDPKGTEVTSCFAEYGPSGSYAFTAACEPEVGSKAVSVSAKAASLQPGTSYTYRFLVTYKNGPEGSLESLQGSEASFVTALSVTTNPASASWAYSGSTPYAYANLTGYVATGASPVSSCNFEYGTSPSLGSSVACTQSPTTGSTYVSASLAWLPWSTNYYVRLSATGTAGTSYGAVQTFQTPSPVPSLYTPLPTTTTVGTTYTPYPYPTYTPPPPVSSYPSYRPSSRAAAIARCMRLRGAKRKKCLSALNRRGGGGGRGPKSDNGLSVYYCPYGRTSAARAASILGAGPDVARAASTSEAGWPAKECLKMDKGPAGQHHTIVGMRHVHNWLLGGWGSDTIVGGEKGDVIWGDYQDCCWPSHQTAIIHAGNGRNVIYANDSLNYVWTGTNPKTIVHAHASGIEGVIHCGSSAQVIFLSSVSEKHFKLDHCGRISHYSVGY